MRQNERGRSCIWLFNCYTSLNCVCCDLKIKTKRKLVRNLAKDNEPTTQYKRADNTKSCTRVKLVVSVQNASRPENYLRHLQLFTNEVRAACPKQKKAS